MKDVLVIFNPTMKVWIIVVSCAIWVALAAVSINLVGVPKPMHGIFYIKDPYLLIAYIQFMK